MVLTQQVLYIALCSTKMLKHIWYQSYSYIGKGEKKVRFKIDGVES